MSEHTKEANPTITPRRLAAGVGILGASLALVFGTDLVQSTPVAAYRQAYIENDGCLANTSFDPSQGAQLDLEVIEGSTRLAVSEAPEHTNPVTIHLSLVRAGLGGIEFVPADDQAHDFLASHGCLLPAQP